jgi:hypothetical protein
LVIYKDAAFAEKPPNFYTMPNQNHPLTRAYILGARATTQLAYSEALRLIRACEGAADQLTIDQCKLAAEVLLERKMP